MSPINFVRKLTSVGKQRLIQDFSYPYDQLQNGVNALVPPENKKVKYSGVFTVAAMAWALQDKELWAARMDIKRAFKNLPIKKDQWYLMGFKFQNKFFVHTQVPFGVAVSCQLFEKVVHCLQWILIHITGHPFIDHYLDDFYLLERSKSRLTSLMGQFTEVVEKKIGFLLSHNKTMGPDQVREYMGLTTGLKRMCISLPEDKMQKALSWVNHLLEAFDWGQFVLVKALEKAAGMLNFTCQVLPVAKPFLHHLYTLQYAKGDNKTLRKMSHKAVADLRMFQTFLQQDSPYFVRMVLFKNLLGLNFNPVDIRAEGRCCGGHHRRLWLLV